MERFQTFIDHVDRASAYVLAAQELPDAPDGLRTGAGEVLDALAALREQADTFRPEPAEAEGDA
jgi:hypothetical protein